MTISPRLLCFLIAAVVFAIAAFWASPPRVNLLAAGLFFFVLGFLFG